MRRLWLCGLPLVLSCDIGPRDEEYDFEERVCGEWSGPRDPDPTVEELPAVLSGSALRTDDGAIQVTLSPLIASATGEVVAQLDPEGLTVELDGTATTNFQLDLVTPEVPAEVDIVFVLDTTGSMAWAITGVKTGIDLFLDGIDAFGFDVTVGGIEYGDGVRTSVELGDTQSFRTWMDAMTAIGGGDAPENPLEALEQAYADLSFRRGALRYFIVITDQGVHEATDDTECATTNLADTASILRGNALLSVVHAELGEPAGVDPRWLTRTMGGLYVNIDFADALVDFDLSIDTEADDILGAAHVVRIPEGADAGSVQLTYDWDGTPLTLDLPVE